MPKLFLLILSFCWSTFCLAQSQSDECSKRLTTIFKGEVHPALWDSESKKACTEVAFKRERIECVGKISSTERDWNRSITLGAAVSICRTSVDSRLHSCLRKNPTSMLNYSRLSPDILAACQKAASWESLTGIAELADAHHYTVEDLLGAGFSAEEIDGVLGGGSVLNSFQKASSGESVKSFFRINEAQNLSADLPVSGLELQVTFTNQYTDAKSDGRDLLTILPFIGIRGIREVSLANATLSDLSPLSSLKDLSSLQLKSLPVVELSPLSKLEKLSFLEIDRIPIQTLSDLRPMASLQSLRLHHLKLPSLSGLENSNELKLLDLSDSTINDLSLVESFAELRNFVASYAVLDSLDILSNLDHLETIYIDHTQVTSLLGLTGIKTIVALNIDGTMVKSLAPIYGLSNLRFISMRDTKIDSLLPIEKAAFGVIVDLRGCSISEYQISLFSKSRPDAKIIR